MNYTGDVKMTLTLGAALRCRCSPTIRPSSRPGMAFPAPDASNESCGNTKAIRQQSNAHGREGRPYLQLMQQFDGLRPERPLGGRERPPADRQRPTNPGAV
jgi:hypothetical protein